jgi:hypothetical protein
LHSRQSLIGSAIVGAWSLAFSPVAAEPLSDSEKIARLERQTELLQRELKAQRAARDSGWGRHELPAMQRFFTDSTSCVAEAPTGCVVGTASRKTSFGAGVGGNFLLPVIPNYLHVMEGYEQRI